MKSHGKAFLAEVALSGRAPKFQKIVVGVSRALAHAETKHSVAGITAIALQVYAQQSCKGSHEYLTSESGQTLFKLKCSRTAPSVIREVEVRYDLNKLLTIKASTIRKNLKLIVDVQQQLANQKIKRINLFQLVRLGKYQSDFDAEV